MKIKPKPLRAHTEKRTPSGTALTELILAVLATSATLQTIGPSITQDPQIVAVRWRILSAVSAEAKTAAELGRELGISRQGALLNVRSLLDLGYVQLLDNPDDQRAMKVGLTPAGISKLAEVTDHQVRWVNALARQFRREDVASAKELLLRLEELARSSVEGDDFESGSGDGNPA